MVPRNSGKRRTPRTIELLPSALHQVPSTHFSYMPPGTQSPTILLSYRVPIHLHIFLYIHFPSHLLSSPFFSLSFLFAFVVVKVESGFIHKAGFSPSSPLRTVLALHRNALISDYNPDSLNAGRPGYTFRQVAGLVGQGW